MVLHDLGNCTELANKQRRYRAYREAARALEYGARERLPPCLEQKIKEMFPDETYTGYKAAATVRANSYSPDSDSVSVPMSNMFVSPLPLPTSAFIARSSEVMYV